MQSYPLSLSDLMAMWDVQSLQGIMLLKNGYMCATECVIDETDFLQKSHLLAI